MGRVWTKIKGIILAPVTSTGFLPKIKTTTFDSKRPPENVILVQVKMSFFNIIIIITVFKKLILL